MKKYRTIIKHLLQNNQCTSEGNRSKPEEKEEKQEKFDKNHKHMHASENQREKIIIRDTRNNNKLVQ